MSETPASDTNDYPMPPRAESDVSDWVDCPVAPEELQELKTALAQPQSQIAVGNLRRFARHTARKQTTMPVAVVIPSPANPGAPRTWQQTFLSLSIAERLDFAEVLPYEDAAIGAGLSVHNHTPNRAELQQAWEAGQRAPVMGGPAYGDGLIPYVEVPAGNPDAITLGLMNLNDGSRSRFLLSPDLPEPPTPN